MFAAFRPWSFLVKRHISAIGVAVALGLAPLPAFANTGALVVRYGLTLAGLPIGTATVTFHVTDHGTYSIAAAAKVGGVMSLISDGRGSANASGHLGSDRPQPSAYALNSMSGKKPQTVQLALANGAVTATDIEPPPAPRGDRIPVRAADKRGVIDPLSALLVPVAGDANALTASACRRTLPVFDGAQRFDIPLSYSRTEHVRGNGYDGAVIVCSARYVPIAGHRPEREQTKFMAANRDLEFWLAPINGTHVLAPWRIVVGTQIGRLTIDTIRYGATGSE